MNLKRRLEKVEAALRPAADPLAHLSPTEVHALIRKHLEVFAARGYEPAQELLAIIDRPGAFSFYGDGDWATALESEAGKRYEEDVRTGELVRRFPELFR